MEKTQANTAIWDALSVTDPKQTKGFKRSGGFTGTAIKPMWVWKRLTERFGPCGKGWGCDEPKHMVVPGHHGEVLIYCTVAGWYIEGGEKCHVWGVGGDKVVSYTRADEQRKRPERWDCDDEAQKKAFTDALMNAFKYVGVAADVHMGLFDDNKYVQQAARAFSEAANTAPATDSHEREADARTTSAQAKRDGLWNVILTKFAEAKTVDDLGERYDWFLNNGKVPVGWKDSYDEEYEKRRMAIIDAEHDAQVAAQ